MFFRRKLSGRTEYLQIVKNDRVDGRPRQSVVATLGRVDELAQDGTLERLLRSGDNHCGCCDKSIYRCGTVIAC